MLPFFRKIRYSFAKDNQFFKYSRYAIGEIVLVVIGILIALYINSWNQKRIERNKEVVYLTEIRKNLVQDTLRINDVLSFNEAKRQAIIETYQIFEKATEKGFNLTDFAMKMNPLSQYRLFYPMQTAFNNLLDVEGIDLVSNLQLRTKLSDYYNTNYEKGTQEVIKFRTRDFTDYAGYQLTTQESVHAFAQTKLEIKTNSMSELHKDHKMITLMMHMAKTLEYHDAEMRSIKDKILEMLALLDTEINRFD
jgi:hypothetical protein